MYQNQHNACSEVGAKNLGPDAPQKVASPTLSRIFELREDQDITQRLINELEERLSDVLCSPPPPGDGKALAASLPPSPLCEEIERRIGLQRGINARLSALVNRITV